MDRVVGQTIVTVQTGNFSGQHSANRTIDITHGDIDGYLFASFERGFGEFDQPVIERSI